MVDVKPSVVKFTTYIFCHFVCLVLWYGTMIMLPVQQMLVILFSFHVLWGKCVRNWIFGNCVAVI